MSQSIKTNKAKRNSFEVHRKLIRSGELRSASRLLRALNNGVTCIVISYSDTDWTLGQFLCENRFKSVKIQ